MVSIQKAMNSTGLRVANIIDTYEKYQMNIHALLA